MQNWKKGYVFGHIDKFVNGHDAQIKKNASKNAYLGSIFIPEKHVFRVCFENPFTRMISSLKYKWPPGLKMHLKTLLPITFSSPRAQPEVQHFLIPNESPYFSGCKLKILALNSL